MNADDIDPRINFIPASPDSGVQPYQSEDEMLIDACTLAAHDMESLLGSTAGIYVGSGDKAALRRRIAQLREYVDTFGGQK